MCNHIDFDTWADTLTDGYKSVQVAKALREAFSHGYDEGAEHGWVDQWEQEFNGKEDKTD